MVEVCVEPEGTEGAVVVVVGADQVVPVGRTVVGLQVGAEPRSSVHRVDRVDHRGERVDSMVTVA